MAAIYTRANLDVKTQLEIDGRGVCLPEESMKVGARNRIIGKITDVKKGTLMCLVKVEIPAASKMASVMTLESLDELGVKRGDEVEIVVKAVNVLLVK